jgi:hypothetical protein
MKEEEQIMNMPHNAYEVNQARIQYMLEGDNRERLADIARAGSEKPSRISKVLNVLQRAVQQNAPVEQGTASVGEVIPSATNS